MGDRTYCRIEIAAKHKAILGPMLEEQGFSESDEENGIVSFEDTEANYGAVDFRQELGLRGLPFFGGHDAGGDYTAALFAFDGVRQVEVDTVDDKPACAIDMKTAEPCAAGLQNAKDYIAVFNAATLAMQDQTPDPICRCQNCDSLWLQSELKPVTDVSQRVEPGVR